MFNFLQRIKCKKKYCLYKYNTSNGGTPIIFFIINVTLWIII